MSSLKYKWVCRSLIAALLCGLTYAVPLVLSSIDEHEHLRIQNTFKSAEEVVRYYCARDASGFVWSGLLDSERRAFTLWKEVPQQESFYIAKTYEILAVPLSSRRPNEATVEVCYQVIGIGDANGALIPSQSPDYRVQFELKRVGSQWKIAKPLAGQISPVVLETKFPFPERAP